MSERRMSLLMPLEKSEDFVRVPLLERSAAAIVEKL